jgi:hypothetical protein
MLMPGVEEPEELPAPTGSPAEQAAEWRAGKLPVGQLARNREERYRQWLEGLCGSWCLDRQLFETLLEMGSIDADGFLTEKAFGGA